VPDLFFSPPPWGPRQCPWVFFDFGKFVHSLSLSPSSCCAFCFSDLFNYSFPPSTSELPSRVLVCGKSRGPAGRASSLRPWCRAPFFFSLSQSSLAVCRPSTWACFFETPPLSDAGLFFSFCFACFCELAFPDRFLLLGPSNGWDLPPDGNVFLLP